MTGLYRRTITISRTKGPSPACTPSTRSRCLLLRSWDMQRALDRQAIATFGGMSVLLFGGGYVFIPMIQQIVVDGYGWVTRQESSNAIALGQVTPGPILISAASSDTRWQAWRCHGGTVRHFTPPRS